MMCDTDRGSRVLRSEVSRPGHRGTSCRTPRVAPLCNRCGETCIAGLPRNCGRIPVAQFVVHQRLFGVVDTSPHRLMVAIDPTLESSQVTRASSSPLHLPGPMSDGGSLWRNRVAGTGGASRIRCARRLALTAPKLHAGWTHDRPGRRRRTKPGMSPEPDDDVHHWP